MTNIVRFISCAFVFLSLVIFGSASATAAPSAEEIQKVVCNLRSNPDLITILQKSPDYQGVTCKQRAAVKPVAQAPQPAQPRQTAGTAPSAEPPAGKIQDNVPPDPYGILLRNDWSDVGLLGSSCFQKAQQTQTPGKDSTVSASNAKGATASFTRDYANSNSIWQTQAMAAVTYTACDLNLAPWPNAGYIGTFEKTVALYAQVNSDYNSNAALAKKNNQDTRTAGLSGEFGFLWSESFNVIRVIPNVVFDNIKNMTDGAVELQYVPIWVGNDYIWHFTPLFDSFSLRFDPTLDLQYASAMGNSKGLQFSSGKDQSLRLGPELTFIINNDSPGFWGNVVFSETFHPWYETYSGRGNYWWDNSVSYNITKNVGLKFSYDRGLDENSGATTNQYIVSLTGKI